METTKKSLDSLKVGDKVIHTSSLTGRQTKITVTRITPTQIVLARTKYRIKYY